MRYFGYRWILFHKHVECSSDRSKVVTENKIEEQLPQSESYFLSMMLNSPEYSDHISLVLSNVLSDIGLNETGVAKRRRDWMLTETISSITYKMLDQTKLKRYYYGGQSEATTTLGLHSDTKVLFDNAFFNTIQDWHEWEPGRLNAKIIQDNTTTPGHCKLQLLRNDVPLPTRDALNQYTALDQHGRVLLTNRMFYRPEVHLAHGPAADYLWADTDAVLGSYCNSWPVEAQSWLYRESIGGWPSSDLRQSAAKTGCFLLPMNDTDGITQWRISLTLADRHLTFSLNITQIRCLVLMKMIVKTFIDPIYWYCISGYIIKTVLFHCIANTNGMVWQENNLLNCLTLCLMELKSCISNKNCPCFFINKKNLFQKGPLDGYIRYRLIESINHLLNSNGTMLLGIHIDDIGFRISSTINRMPSTWMLLTQTTPNCISNDLEFRSKIFLTETIASCYKQVLGRVMHGSSSTAACEIKRSMYHLFHTYRGGQRQEKTACTYLAPLLCSSLGSVLASDDITANGSLSSEACDWMSTGVNSDVASGRLKLASARYCAGDITGSEILLRETLNKYNQNNAKPACSCTPRVQRYNYRSIESIKESTAFCVQFLRCEENCVPQELQYEMFRSSRSDMLYRDEEDSWMDCAAIDSLPYLYFLQYKTYKGLRIDVQKQQALTNLADIIDREPNLGHRETALNLLGQCMEQETRLNDALSCYILSLKVHERNNAARTHICRLLAIIQIQRISEANHLHTDRSTVTSCEREEQGLSNSTAASEGIQTDVQTACAVQSTNLFKKDFENTLAEKLVDDMSVKMKSVGAIVYEGVRGTVFRVGSKYVMTALHVVTGITNPKKCQSIPKNDWSKLEDPTVRVTFATSAMDLQSPSFYLKRDVIFMDIILDVAVLELKPGNVLPRRLQLSKDMGQIDHVNLIGFGHPTDPRKQLDPNCKIVAVTDQLIRRIQTENENILRRSFLRTVLQHQGLDLNILTEGSYTELLDSERFVCHAAMEHGASGAPAIAENEVVGIFVKGLPKFYYELRSSPSTAQYIQHFPNQLRFELCSKTDYIYTSLRRTNPMLAADLFD